MSDARVAGDVACVKCGYNLRTLAVTGTCPECGEKVQTTLAGNPLPHDRALVRRLQRGVMLTLCGMGMVPATLLLASVLGTYPAESTITNAWAVAAGGVLGVGWWILCAPKLMRRRSNRDTAAYWIARGVAVVRPMLWLAMALMTNELLLELFLVLAVILEMVGWTAIGWPVLRISGAVLKDDVGWMGKLLVLQCAATVMASVSIVGAVVIASGLDLPAFVEPVVLAWGGLLMVLLIPTLLYWLVAMPLLLGQLWMELKRMTKA